jgi:hypothetical protein
MKPLTFAEIARDFQDGTIDIDEVLGRFSVPSQVAR